jgi:hypothetical protein
MEGPRFSEHRAAAWRIDATQILNAFSLRFVLLARGRLMGG